MAVPVTEPSEANKAADSLESTFPFLTSTESRQLVVTLPTTGDVECGTTYSSTYLSRAPMVTWFPVGSSDDRFCLAVLARTARGAHPRLTWLVCDIPGQRPCDDPIVEPCCFGLAGNCWAIGLGAEVAVYENPAGAGELLFVLWRQPDGSGQLAVRLAAVSVMQRDAFVADTFAAEHNLGLPEATSTLRFADTPATQGSSGPPIAEQEKRCDAYSSGGKLVVDPSAPTTLTDALCRSAEAFPERGLTVYDGSGRCSRLTFSTLRKRSRSVCEGLRAKAAELTRDAASPSSSSSVASSSLMQRAVLQVPGLADHFVAFWGCLLSCTCPVAVAIPPSYEDAAHAVCGKLRNTWQLLEQPPVIASQLHLGKVAALRRSAGMTDLRLLALEELEGLGEGALPTANPRSPQPLDVAFYQLSSGSTGIPKCIQITHRGVVSHVLGEAQFCGFNSNDVNVNFLPLDHVVPILTVHCCDVFHGCEEVQADVAWVVSEPLRWLRLVSDHRATRTWAPNFAFKLVADALRRRPHGDAEREFDLSCCRQWMNAGEQVTMPVCEDFLEQTRHFGVQRRSLQPAFGMAEACTCMTYNSEFDVLSARRLGRSTFVNLGPPVPGIEIRIADDENRTVPEEVVGRFQIRGPVITPGYLRNEEANEAAFVGQEWFNTGDIGFVKDGRLYLTGREKEMIIIRGANFYCYEIEDVVNALPAVLPTFTAAVSAHDPVTGTEGLGIFFVPRDTSAVNDFTGVVREIRNTLVRHMGLTPSHVVPLRQEEFPKTTSGKIQRADLSRALRDGDFARRSGSS